MSKPYKRASDGRWAWTFELPRRADGERRRVSVYGKSRGEVLEKGREKRREIEAKGGDLSTGTPTVEAWLNYWLEGIAGPKLRPRTRENYRHMVSLITPSVGKVKLDKLTPAHVRRMSAWIEAKPKDPDKPERGTLSSTTARNAHAVLRKAINDARAEGVLRGENVAEIAGAPEKAHYVVTMLDHDQALTLLRSVATDERATIRWSLALMMAMRQGECLGLRADHVDLEAGTIYVEWQLQALEDEPRKGSKFVDLGGGYYLTPPKTGAGERVIPMPAQLAEMMRRYLPTIGRDDYVCGPGIVDPSKDERAWKAALKAAGLPPVRLHSARHSAMTLLAKLGVRDDVRQRIAGHASARVTREVYTHADDADTRAAMSGLGEALAIEA